MTIQELTERSFEKAVLIDFWAEWCGPCRTFTPVLEKTLTKFSDHIQLEKIDVDKSRSLAAQFRIQSIPTIVLLKDGKVAGVSQGAMSETQLEGWLKEQLPDLMENVDESDLSEVLENLPEIPDPRRLEILEKVLIDQKENKDVQLEYLRTLVFLRPEKSISGLKNFQSASENEWLITHMKTLAEFLISETDTEEGAEDRSLTEFRELTLKGNLHEAADQLVRATAAPNGDIERLTEVGAAFFASLGDKHSVGKKSRKLFNMYLN